MRVLVTGVKGQLGYDVVRELEKRNHIAIGTDIEEMDITDRSAVMEYIKNADVDAVIHCAAYTAVDNAEDDVDRCTKINVGGTENIALACKAVDAKMIYISTDYVFSGEGTNFWSPDDACSPLNIYGMTKYQGEQKVSELLEKYYIVRISWVFGINGKNFVKTMLRLGETHDKLTVVCDQIGSPTYTYDLARLLVDMAETDKYGVYHATNEGVCSWYEFACEIFKSAGMSEKVSVAPVDSSAYPAKAKRPSNSRMSKEKLDVNGFAGLPDWQDAVNRYIKELNGEIV